MAAWGCSNSAGPGDDSGILLCTGDPDCPQGFTCLDGLCTLPADGGCTIDADCPDGQVCRLGACVTDQADGGDGDDGDGAADGDGPPPEPAVAVEPALIDFGNGRVGQVVEQILRVRSVGGADLTVFSLQMSADTSPEFGAAPLGTELNEILPPGANLEVRVTYAPQDGSVDYGTLLISTNAPSQALIQVPLSSSYKGVSEISVVEEPGSELDAVQQVDFGPVALGGASRRVVFIKNAGNGNAVLEIEEVRTNPLVSDHFSLEVNPAPPAFLSPSTGPCALDEDCGAGNLCQAGVCLDPTGQVLGLVSVAIDFAPASVGAIQETLVIANDEGDGAGDGDEQVRLVVLRGEGIQPNLSVEPNPIEFDTLFTGQRAELPVTLRNLGGQALTLVAIELVDGSGPFALDLGGLASWTLLPGESAQILASFAPDEAGAQQDILEVRSDDPDSPARVDLLGQAALPPALELTPEGLVFGEVQLGQSLELVFSVRNAGGGPLQVTSLELVTAGSEFALVEQALPALQPGEAAQVHVVYAPLGGIGADANLVRVRSDDPARPEATLPLDGLATDPDATLEPQAMDFGAVYPGSTAGPRLAIVRNSGFGTLRVTSLGLVGSADFTLGAVSPALPAALTFGEGVQVEVFFTPQSAGPRSAELTVATSDVEAFSLTLPISGAGSDCPLGWWDANGDPADGCEYACELSAGGVEECDGQDNDCDAQSDELLDTRVCTWAVPGVGTCSGEETCAHEQGWIGCSAAEPQPELCNSADDDCDTAVDAADNSLRLSPCELDLGVCLGAVHRAVLCQAGAWQACTALDYGASYGPETCDRLDSDCDGLTDADDPDLLPEPCANQLGLCGGSVHAPAQCSPLGVWQDCTDAEYEARDPRFGDEVCDGVDNDCDGQADSGDASLTLPLCEKQIGLCAGAAKRPGLCYQGAWHACLEADYQAHDPRYDDTELCDGQDNDCTGAPGAGEVDGDGDGYRACAGDCDDTPGSGVDIHPGAVEVCDGIDNDCDGFVDGEDPQLVLTPCELTLGVCAGTFHRADQCLAGGVWAACNASNYGAGYGAEICDAGLDNDCDGLVNAGDPGLQPAPCENQAGVCNGAFHVRAQCQVNGTWLACGAAEYEARDPRYGAEECDGADNDCNSLQDEADAALVIPPCENQTGLCAGALHRPLLCNGALGWRACEAADYEAHDAAYSATELCDGVDNDCSGTVPANEADADGDGYRVCGGDCNDSPPAGAAIHPGAVETCDGVDNDCDGFLDGNDPQLVLAPCELSQGVCASKFHRADQCGAGGVWAACDGSNYGASYGAEVCDAGLDNDCDGLTNAADASLVLAPCGNQAGVCSGALHARAQCQANGTWTACAAADYEAHDALYGVEECDGADNDCDGQVDGNDASLSLPLCEKQGGLCAGAAKRPGLCYQSAWHACTEADYQAHDARYDDVELCDGLDNDCSGTVPANEADADGDGHRVCGGDCNDSPPAGAAIHPGAAELCDSVDNDCDTYLDGADPQLVLTPCELTLGVCTSKLHRADQCGAGGVWAACNASNYGAAYGVESCDAGLDNDCDGLTNAGDPSLTLAPCENQAGVCNGTLHARAQCQLNGTWQACVNADYEAHDPRFGNEECDGADNNCNSLLDEADPALVIPPCENQTGLCAGALHRPLLCNGALGWGACEAADYEAHDATYNAAELCDGLDNDCSGTVPASEADADGDGYRVCGGDCNDSPPVGTAIHPGAAELCDGVDNDCDTYLDGADPQLVLTPCELTLGVCASTYHRADQCVSGGWAACNASNYGASYGVESCDAGLDNDCDGLTNAVDPSLTLAPCENQAGVCSGALHARAQCQLGGSWLSCGAAQYEAHDARYGDEVCDGVDNNCNAQLDQVDPLLIRPLCENQTGLCAGALHRASLCQAGAGWASCDATDYELNDPAYNAAELCDRVDNDCSGGLPAAEVDGDGDGYTPCEGDCLDGDIDVNPGELEVCNSKDDDCDGFTDALDGSLELAPCELQAGVCAGSEHALNQCVAGGWLPCTDSEYTAHSAYFGEEVCGDAGSRDEDCSGVTNDRDADEDGYLHIACGGNDCNDDSAAAHPGASEVQDLTDNDCDGLVDEGVIPVGSLIVTELLPNPGLPGDAYGEWFEVYNDSAISVNLHSWRIRDDGTNMFQVAAPAGLIIAPGQSMVFCRNGDPELNGGVVCDYVYGEGGNVFELANSGGDEIVLTLDGLIIDWMNYSTTTDGRSRSLDPSAYDDGANDTLANWCVTPANAAYQLPGGDYGTPGQMNVLCAGSIALASVSPGSGIEQGGETLTLQGTGFTGATAVSVCGAACASFSVVDDNAITCVTAAHAPADCDVTVTKGPASSTLTAAYRFTGVDGSPGIGWCDLQWPLTATARVGSDSELVFGRVWKSGVTEPAGAPAGITGQLGYGPLGSDPRSSVGWRWLTANWNPSCVGCGNNDEFMRQFNLPVTGTWSYVYRFSDDGGYTYVFCDFNPGAPPFSTGEMGTLTVTP